MPNVTPDPAFYPPAAFWDTLEQNRPQPYDADAHIDAVRATLGQQHAHHIVAFTLWQRWALRELFTGHLFEHAAEHFGAGTNDRFQYFRLGILYQGQEVFKRVRSGDYGHERFTELTDEQFWPFENALSLPQEAYEVGDPDGELEDLIAATGYQPAPYPNLYDLPDGKTALETLSEQQQQQALAIVARWMGQQFGYDAPVPTGQKAYRNGTGIMLEPEWSYEEGTTPVPTIFHESTRLDDWALQASLDPEVLREMLEIRVLCESITSYALGLYPHPLADSD